MEKTIIYMEEEMVAMDERELKLIIKKASNEAAKEEMKIKMLEYKMDFGTLFAKVTMSLN